MKILNPIVTPVRVERSPSGQMRIKTNAGGKLCAVRRGEFDEQEAQQIATALNAQEEIVKTLDAIARACEFDESLYEHDPSRRKTGTTRDIRGIAKMCRDAIAKARP